MKNKTVSAKLSAIILSLILILSLSSCDFSEFRYVVSDSGLGTIIGSEVTETQPTTDTEASTTTATATTQKPTSTTKTQSSAQKPGSQTTQQSGGAVSQTSMGYDELVYNLSSAQKQAYQQIVDGVKAFKATIAVTSSLTLDQVEAVFTAINNNEFTYLQMSTRMTTYYDKSSGKVNSVKIEYNYNASETQAMLTKLEARVQQILGGIKSGMSEFDKLKYLHDTIIKNCTYDLNAPNPYNAYGALVEGRAVCEGYSKAMALLCKRAGIECAIVTGKGDNVEHMWNMIKFNGNWYHMDVTWDDPTGHSDPDYVGYAYFNITTAQIMQSHTIDTGSPYSVPVATATEGNYYVYTRTYASTYAEATNIIMNEAIRLNSSKGSVVTIKISDSAAYQSICTSLFKAKNPGIFTIINAVNSQVSNKLDTPQYQTIDSSNIINIYLNYK